MFKHLQKMALLAAMMLLPWMGQAQVLIDYTFTTGVDQSKWISVPASTTSLLSTTGDGVASAVTSLGFNFPFGEGTYSQFSVNSDGTFVLVPLLQQPPTTQPPSRQQTPTLTIRRSISSVVTAMPIPAIMFGICTLLMPMATR